MHAPHLLHARRPPIDRPAAPLIVVADADATRAATAARLLSETGFRVRTGTDVATTLHDAAGLAPAAVLLHLEPDPDATAALVRALRLREAQHHARHLLVVAVGGFAADRARGLDAGLDDVLEAPLRADQLLAALARHRHA
jgi:DNA-binding response OmpR family regulator